MISPRMRLSRSIALASVIALGAAGCGGDNDTTEAARAAAADGAEEALADAAKPVDAGGDVVDSIADALGGEAGADLDAAIDSIGADTVMRIVADQLGEDTTVAVDGSKVTFTIPAGSNEGTDPVTHCLVAGAFKEDGQTITMVYPDGKTVCS